MQVLMKRYKILDYLLVGDENYSKELRKTRVDNINPSKHPSSQVLFYISWATEWKKVPVHAHILTARYIVTDARAECMLQILNATIGRLGCLPYWCLFVECKIIKKIFSLVMTLREIYFWNGTDDVAHGTIVSRFVVGQQSWSRWNWECLTSGWRTKILRIQKWPWIPGTIFRKRE